MNDYAYYKSIGICPDCKKRDAEEGKVHCKICLAQRRANQKTHRERFNKAWQAFDKRRRENGLCRACGKPSGDSLYCPNCAEIRKIKRRIITLRKKKGTWTGRLWDDYTQRMVAFKILAKWGLI